MKQKIICVSIICLICVSIAACRPTPENSAVVNKNQGVLEERINREALASVYTDIPDSVNETVYEGKFSILINAGVKKLTLDEYPVYTIGPADFAQEEVDTIIKYFFDDSPLYSMEYKKSKSMIQDELVETKANLQKIRPEDTDDIEAAQQSIKELEEEYLSAPDTVQRTRITSELVYSSNAGCEMLMANVDLGYDELSSIKAANQPLFQFISISVDKNRWFAPSPPLAGKNAEGQKMTPGEAQRRAEEALTDMGIADMAATKTQTGESMDQSRQGYIVTFCRDVSGLPVAYNKILKTGRPDMAAEWSGDQIKICLDDEGISYFSWYYKGKVEKQTTSNVEMLKFGEIMDIARQQLKNKFVWNDSSEKDIGQAINVDSIVLEYTCTQRKDDPNGYLLLPAWNFYTSGEEMASKNYYCVLSLNAVDGSVIG